MTTLTLREAAEKALVAMEYMHTEKVDYMIRNSLGNPSREDTARLAIPAIVDLRAALAAAPAAAPEGWQFVPVKLTPEMDQLAIAPRPPEPTSPPAAKPLTDEQINDFVRRATGIAGGRSLIGEQVNDFVRIVEAAHGIGGKHE